MFELKQIIVKKDGYTMVACDTRFPWLHKNFGGWEGWRKALNDALQRDGHKGYHILGRLFEHLIFLDADTTELWLKPRYEAGTLLARFGWLYWAICWMKRTRYPNPARAQADWYEKTVESKLRVWGGEGMKRELCLKLTAPNKCTECGRFFGLYYLGTDCYWCAYCGSEGRIYQVTTEEDILNQRKIRNATLQKILA